jgi:hypothetical protein
MQIKSKSFGTHSQGADNIFECEQFINANFVIEVITSGSTILVIYKIF